MKIIHCADIHLDSALNANLGKEKADIRRQELVSTFQRLIQYGRDETVDAILIAGDLFDTQYPSYNTIRMFCDMVRATPEIQFYYIRGNHDVYSKEMGKMNIENLHLFHDQWTTYQVGNKGIITISGMEFNGENNNNSSRLELDQNQYNIVLLHGQACDYNLQDNKEGFLLSSYRNKNIDYLALGHIHRYQLESLDNRGLWCYSGCLEPRGFDECGQKGFVLLHIEEDTRSARTEFVPFAKREIFYYDIDISSANSEYDIQCVVEDSLREHDVDSSSICKLNLIGELGLDCNKNMDGLEQKLKEYYYFIKIVDSTRIKIPYNSYLMDDSLKGEFVRMVIKDSTLSEEEKEKIIYNGISVFQGRGISL